MNEKKKAVKYLMEKLGERYWIHGVRHRLIMIKLVIIRTRKHRYDYQREEGLC